VVRVQRWNGLGVGDPVCVDGPRERRQSWVFVAYAVNEATGEEWVEVRGGRIGESKGRAFHPDAIYPATARRGRTLRGLPVSVAPLLDLGAQVAPVRARRLR
jgi:hypothetical protein